VWESAGRSGPLGVPGEIAVRARLFVWLIAASLVLVPLLGSVSPMVFAEGDDNAPAQAVAADASPVVDVAASPSDPETATPTPTETSTETPTNTPTATETATNTPTATATATPIPAKLADVKVAVSCLGNPETVTVTNTGKGTFKITKIRYIYQNAWYSKSRSLGPGQSAVFKTGPNASGDGVTSKLYRLTDAAGDSDGARVTTSVGDAVTMCPPVPAKLSDVKISVNCLGNPETVTISNSGKGVFYVAKIRYLAQNKWYAKSTTVAASKSIVYKTGPKASGTGFTSSVYRLTDALGSDDGVRVTTSVGDVIKMCPPLTGERWIEVNLSSQTLIAWQGSVRIKSSLISSGKDGFETPTGTFYINAKYRYKDMAACENGECWYEPDVQYAMYFTYEGHAIHAVTWHNDFGIARRSHGCVGAPLGFAGWLYYWADYGTRIWIHY
jgi:lipoprotein-anchoring transpeptidase ErfK/SrfK